MLSVLALLAAGGGLYLASQRNWGDSTAQQRADATSSISQDDLKQALAPLQQSIKDLQAANQRAADQISDLKRAADKISDFRPQLSAELGEQKLLNQQVAALSARLDGITNAEAATPGQADERNIANAKKKTSTHPATTAGARQAASPQDGTAATPDGMAGGAPQDLMSQPGATALDDMAVGAPVGHRQPRRQDVPPQQRNPHDSMTKKDEAFDKEIKSIGSRTKEDEALDKKIKNICRGC